MIRALLAGLIFTTPTTAFAAHAAQSLPAGHNTWRLEANGDWNCPSPAKRCFVSDIPRKR
jgi:hypothetical protein